MEVMIHKEAEPLKKIIPEWKILKEDFREITIFQDRDWLQLWWDFHSSQAIITPYILEIKESDKTIGVIPLYISKTFQFRVLKPIGSGNSDYLIPILSNKYSSDHLLHLALTKINEDKSSWDYIEWVDVPGDSFFAHFLNHQQMENSKWIMKKQGAVCPLLKLNDNIENMEHKLNKKFLKEILSKERKLNKDGKLQYSKVMSIQEIEPVMNKFFELHCERWNNTETPSEFRHKEARDHAISIANNLFKNNLLHLGYLSHENEILVVHFGMSDGKKEYLYMHAINNNYKKYSPGSILVYKIILEACRNGYEMVDFLRGEEEYKKKWGTTDKVNVKYIIFNRSIKSLLFKNIYHTIYANHHLKHIVKRLIAKTS